MVIDSRFGWGRWFRRHLTRWRDGTALWQVRQFKASPKFELVALNALGEPSESSVAPSNGELFIRTHTALWCIGPKAP